MFRHMPFVLIAVIFAVIFLAPSAPLELKQVLYSISLSIKEIIIILLPIIIFGLLFKAAVMMSNSATKILSVILACVCVSNFISTFLSHYVGILVYDFDLSMIKPDNVVGLDSAWELNLPRLLANNHAMFAGIVLGIAAAKLHPKLALKMSIYVETCVDHLLQCVLYVIPLFVAGFIVKLQHDDVIDVILRDYAIIFLFIALAQFAYLALAYFVLSNAKWEVFIDSIKNMLPAAISGFSTMSSAASMPLTIIGVENNAAISTTNTQVARLIDTPTVDDMRSTSVSKDIALSVVPVTVNIHLVGDCFAIPILAYAILKSFGMEEPSAMHYLIFTFYFVLAKFSVAAVPGGGVIVMLPILEKYLGFTGEMMSLITALYILFDPVITSANVLGNGAFAKMIDKVGLFRKKPVTATRTQ